MEAKWGKLILITGLLCESSATTYISNVLGVREVGQIPIVEFLTFQIAAVVPGLQIAGLDAVGIKKLLVSHSESLTDRLGDNLSLVTMTKINDQSYNNVIIVMIHFLDYSASSFFMYINKSKWAHLQHTKHNMPWHYAENKTKTSSNQTPSFPHSMSDRLPLIYPTKCRNRVKMRKAISRHCSLMPSESQR